MGEQWISLLMPLVLRDQLPVIAYSGPSRSLYSRAESPARRAPQAAAAADAPAGGGSAALQAVPAGPRDAQRPHPPVSNFAAL